MKRYVCIHGHFYQPPRENPWLEAIELQDSAYPFHDWNERINAECYENNGVSRILDDEEYIIEITNNYANISFNFGPTVLAWMEDHAPLTYKLILEADEASRERFSGHGSALAQTYNHMIMPLANRRDKVTQVRWGIADFRKRFGRTPEGMWLPETAVDLETLEVLAEHGIKFTILAPKQAGRVRRVGEKQWTDVKHEHVDPTLAYVQKLPSGKSINLFFYDGPISQALAFERLLNSGETFAHRLLEGFPDDANGDGESNDEPPRLVHIATDGETYGHHHRFGDMALAACLRILEENESVELTNYSEFLEQHPPEHEVDIIEDTSWSCVHGVERWRSDCGCHSGMHGDWHQKWREPLRNALDWLRDAVAPKFEEMAKRFFQDPWAARDAYVEVVLDRSPDNVDAFLKRHCVKAWTDENRMTALQLMELQRNCMLMYTSCGWFFDELSGIETVQVIQYAGRAVQLAQQLFGDHLEEQFLDRLEKAPSNIPDLGNGRNVYDRMVRPAMVELEKVGAHFAISSLFEEYQEQESIYCYGVDTKEYRKSEAGRAQLALGQVHVTSQITGENALLTFAVLHLGDHNILCNVRRFRNPDAYMELVNDVEEAFRRADVPETVQRLDQQFGEHRYSLRTLFRDEQRMILDQILDSTMIAIERSYRQVYDDNAPLMRALGSMGLPIPSVLRTTAEFIINHDLRAHFCGPEVDVDAVHTILEDTKPWELKLDTEGLGYALQKCIERAASAVEQQPDDAELLERFEKLARLATTLPFRVDLWQTQNTYYRMLQELYPKCKEKAEACDDAMRGWVDRFRSIGEKLHVKVE